MTRPNKFVSLLLIFAFILNVTSPASACWWKGAMLAHGSPEMTGRVGEGANNTNKANQAALFEPIYLHNGDFLYEFQDLFIPSRGFPLGIKHTYKSQSLLNSSFGCGWDLNYNQRIAALSNGDAYYYDGTNMRVRFSYLDGTNYVSPEDSYDTLIQNADGTWTLTKKHGEKHYFNPNGLLTRIEDRNKNAFSFTYNAAGKLPLTGIPYYSRSLTPEPRVIAYNWQLSKITDSVGRQTNFNYNESGRLSAITDFSGRQVTYAYDINGDLTSITLPPTTDFPSGTTVRFAYTGHKLTSITDGKGQTYLTNFYNGQGMVDAQEYGGNKVYITYNLESMETEAKDGLGFRRVYTFNENGNPLKKEEFTAGLRVGEPGSYVTTYEYNNHSELTRAIYPKGNSVEYNYDEKGNLLEIRRKPVSGSSEADIVTSLTYEPRFNFIKSARDPLGNTTTYYYDYEETDSGDLNGDGLTNQANGNLVKIGYPQVNAQTPEVKFTYNTYGQLNSAIDPNTNTVKYEYFSSTGYLNKVIRGYGLLNITTEMTYDSLGNVLTLKDPKANTTTFAYDSHNNLTKTTSATPFSYISEYKYDPNDNLIQVDSETRNISNPWQTTYYTYDSLDRVITRSQSAILTQKG